MNFQDIFNNQKDFFNSNATKDISFRINQLKKFKQLFKENEELLYKAIYDDFSKSEFETYITEFSLLYHEINTFIKKLRKWSKPKRVASGLANFPAKSYIIPEPLGVNLVMGAWNYPYQLALLPAICALAAGNTVILKPSELPINTSRVLAKLINENFKAEYFHVVEGGVNETTEILKLPFDKIFFTGSIPVGKIVYQAAAKNLTPVTLELGGKSPTFVFADADIKMSAKRIVWAKYLNAGQTCVAPDYLLVEKSIEDKFLEALKTEIQKYHKENSDIIKENYLQIINQGNYERLVKLINQDKVYYGGKLNQDKRFISPTIMKDVNFDDEIMQDEIFGPILPVISFESIDETILLVKSKPKPLSCYIYSKNRKIINKLLSEISFGGGAVNDSIMHLTNSNLPFGGVGFSGIGSYHGKSSFQAFSHYKSILDKALWYESSIKYPPYTDKKLKLIKKLLG